MANLNLQSPTFPQEIFDTFIDFLHQNPSALRECARVSRSWLPRSRFHTFRSVELNCGNVEAFCELVKSPHVTFLQNVQHFGYSCHIPGYASPVGPGGLTTSWTKILPLLPPMKRVTSLGLRCLTFDTPHPTTPTLSTIFPKVHTLELYATRFEFRQDLLNLISGWPTLWELRLSNEVGWSKEDPETHPSSHQMLSASLEILRMDMIPATTFNWISRQELWPSLVRLDIMNIKKPCTESLPILLQNHDIADRVLELQMSLCLWSAYDGK